MAANRNTDAINKINHKSYVIKKQLSRFLNCVNQFFEICIL